MSSCDSCLVRNRAICAVLTPAELSGLNGFSRMKTLGRGEPLIWEGDDAMHVANVISGVLKLSNTTHAGSEQILGLVYPSDFIGRPFGEKSDHSVTALTDAQVCMFTRSKFDNFAREHPELEHKLLERTLAELARARHWMMLLGRKSANGRIASLLLEMSERLRDRTCAFDSAPLSKFELPFTRQQMGDILGLTIETVSRQLTKLRASGVIDTPGRARIVISDRVALEAIAAAD